MHEHHDDINAPIQETQEESQEKEVFLSLVEENYNDDTGLIMQNSAKRRLEESNKGAEAKSI